MFAGLVLGDVLMGLVRLRGRQASFFLFNLLQKCSLLAFEVQLFLPLNFTIAIFSPFSLMPEFGNISIYFGREVIAVLATDYNFVDDVEYISKFCHAGLPIILVVIIEYRIFDKSTIMPIISYYTQLA